VYLKCLLVLFLLFLVLILTGPLDVDVYVDRVCGVATLDSWEAFEAFKVRRRRNKGTIQRNELSLSASESTRRRADGDVQWGWD
jgi:hypothetical protein